MMTSIVMPPCSGKIVQRGLAASAEANSGDDHRRHNTCSEKEDQRLYNVTEERYVMAIFVDIKSAFDSLWWLALMAELKQRDCPRNLYLIIKDYLTKRVVTMEDSYHIVER